MSAASLLDVRGLTKHFPIRRSIFQQVFARTRRPVVKAVDGVDFALGAGEVLGVVGESGCGKSTLGFTLVRLLKPTAGEVYFSGSPIDLRSAAREKAFRREVQIVFQDPYQSLNPCLTVFDTVREPLIIHGLEQGAGLRRRVIAMLDEVGLRPAEAYLARYPHQLSGGQRQRVAIARAIILEPKLLVADEPVSMLDVSIRAGILTLLRRLSEDRGLAIVYISHDISTVRYLCRRTAVMYLGHIVEIGPTEQVLGAPMHPYTRALVAAVPRIHGAVRPRVRLPGEVPSSVDPPRGCVFHPRCSVALPSCSQIAPQLREIRDGRRIACVLYEKEKQL